MKSGLPNRAAREIHEPDARARIPFEGFHNGRGEHAAGPLRRDMKLVRIADLLRAWPMNRREQRNGCIMEARYAPVSTHCAIPCRIGSRQPRAPGGSPR